MSAKAWGRRRQAEWQRQLWVAAFWAEAAESQHERDEAARIIRRLVTRARRYGVSLE
jgi:hypothetical protein